MIASEMERRCEVCGREKCPANQSVAAATDGDWALATARCYRLGYERLRALSGSSAPQAAATPEDGFLRGALMELLRLYDWRFVLAEREKDPRNISDGTFAHETLRLLRQYGTEKKAAWKAARAALSMKSEGSAPPYRMVPMLPVDEEADRRIAALRARQVEHKGLAPEAPPDPSDPDSSQKDPA